MAGILHHLGCINPLAGFQPSLAVLDPHRLVAINSPGLNTTTRDPLLITCATKPEGTWHQRWSSGRNRASISSKEFHSVKELVVE